MKIMVTTEYRRDHATRRAALAPPYGSTLNSK